MEKMTLERAINNAIVSTEMEGFIVTEKHKELIKRVIRNEITLREALIELNNKEGDEK